MIKLITGEKGTGKTKIIIDMMNEAVKSTNGNLVCKKQSLKLFKLDGIKRILSVTVFYFYGHAITVCLDFVLKNIE